MGNHPRRSLVHDWPKFLKKFRANHELTQKQLSDLLQIPCRTLENWECGVNTPAPYLKTALKALENTLNNQ